ncbi:MAG: 4-hydroxy-tetrahydrodipicolinate synthase [Ekhidna sp.]|nr:4-hydroxy-tetrahydrodipicolinate synthase [Ekhidna sp.]MBC6410120.1 4-hydroxy-tetrahydrodipicolinate synthase [Ekhidna sp.]MBC6426051.1 4-hydroxy-tetrahydrodipicolinate synthase [Ekhidna sp.]
MKVLRGVGAALATPLKEDYTIDFEGLEKLVDHVSRGVDYLVVLGTTGESPVFTWEEKLQILDFVFKVNKQEKPVVFGHGGNNTLDLIKKFKDLKKYPLTSILSASPYYSRPSQKGIIRHFEMLAAASPHPVILYNVPSRTASNMKAETTLTLAKHPNIAAMKEASKDLEQCRKILAQQPEDFTFLSGEDSFTLELIQNGAIGIISVIANVLPTRFKEMVEATMSGETDTAYTLNKQLQSAYRLASEEGNPTSIKAGLEALGICKRTVKPPLFDASDELVERWRSII